MSRAVWFVAGAGAGLYAAVRVQRALDVLTPEGLADRLHALRVGAALVREEVATERAAAETHLRERLAAPHPGTPALSGPSGASGPSARPALASTHPADRTEQEGS